MTHARLDSQLLDALDDYLDGELDRAGRARFEKSLAALPELRQALEERRKLLAALGDLPQAVEPPAMAWPALAARVEAAGDDAARDGAGLSQVASPSSRAAAPGRPWLGLAAAVLIAVTLGFALGRWEREETVDSAAATEGVESNGLQPALAVRPAPSRHALSAAELALLEVKSELRRSLEEQLASLPEETVASFESNLETIEKAIAEVRRAIEQHPGTPSSIGPWCATTRTRSSFCSA